MQGKNVRNKQLEVCRLPNLIGVQLLFQRTATLFHDIKCRLTLWLKPNIFYYPFSAKVSSTRINQVLYINNIRRTDTVSVPVQHKSTLPTTLIGRLSTALPASTTNDKDDPRPVIFYAISLLQRIHTDLLTKHEPSPRPGEIVSPKARRIIIALLDLLALEGIYPCLTPGLGIPLGRRARIIPPSKSSNTSSDGVRRLQNLRDVDILGKIISALLDILKDGKGEVVEMLKDRCLVDLVAGCGELAFNPSQNDRLTIDDKVYWQKCWESLIEG